MRDVPGFVLVATIWAYWLGIGIMITRVRAGTHTLAGLVPEQRFEKYLWVIWVPLVVAWIVLPYLAFMRPEFTSAFLRLRAGYALLRWLAAAGALASLLLTSLCWSRMGKHWRLDVSTKSDAELITDGPFAYVRHPIYALQRVHMLCSVVIVPTWQMFGLALVHFWLTQLKARNEERHLLAVHGAGYRNYVARTAMFFPKRRAPPQGEAW